MFKRMVLISLLFLILLSVIGAYMKYAPLTQKNLWHRGLKLIDRNALTAAEDFIAPVWSPTGLDIAFSRYAYKGLYVISASGDDFQELSVEDFSGYNPLWLEDGYNLVYQLRNFSGVKTFSVNLNGIKNPFYGNLESLKQQVREDRRVDAINDEIFLEIAGKTERHTQGEDKFYNPRLSPDGEWLAYEGISSGIHLLNLETREEIPFGEGNRPKWSPDSSLVLYDLTTDDGHELLTGDLFVFSLNTRESINITNTPQTIEQHPDWAPDGRQIAFDADGTIFVGTLR